MDSAFSRVTAEYNRFNGIAPIEAPPHYDRTETDMVSFDKFLSSRAKLTERRNRSHETRPSAKVETDYQEALRVQERNQASRELKSMGACMQMSDGMNFSTKSYVAPGSDAYKALLQNARKHQRKITAWSKFRPKMGMRRIPDPYLEKMHSSLFESPLAHHGFGDECTPDWFVKHIGSPSEALLVSKETFCNDEDQIFTAIAFWIVRSLYFKLYVVFLVDDDEIDPAYHYVDYFYLRFCQPIDGAL